MATNSIRRSITLVGASVGAAALLVLGAGSAMAAPGDGYATGVPCDGTYAAAGVNQVADPDSMLAQIREHIYANTNLSVAQRAYLLQQAQERVAAMVNQDAPKYQSEMPGFGGRWN
jgi:hypothetical protein